MWDFVMEYIVPLFLAIFFVFAIFIIVVFTIFLSKDCILNRNSYIQNLEEKVNIYEQNYDNFVLEENLKETNFRR